jgi:hypothetical protein
MRGPDIYERIVAAATAVSRQGHIPRIVRLGPVEAGGLAGVQLAEGARYTGHTINVPVFDGDDPGIIRGGQAPHSRVIATYTLQIERARESPCLEMLV